MNFIITIYSIALIVGLITLYANEIDKWNEKHLLSKKSN
jgi:hypothetical protein